MEQHVARIHIGLICGEASGGVGLFSTSRPKKYMRKIFIGLSELKLGLSVAQNVISQGLWLQRSEGI